MEVKNQTFDCFLGASLKHYSETFTILIKKIGFKIGKIGFKIFELNFVTFLEQFFVSQNFNKK